MFYFRGVVLKKGGNIQNRAQKSSAHKGKMGDTYVCSRSWTSIGGDGVNLARHARGPVHMDHRIDASRA